MLSTINTTSTYNNDKSSQQSPYTLQQQLTNTLLHQHPQQLNTVITINTSTTKTTNKIRTTPMLSIKNNITSKNYNNNNNNNNNYYY